ncbi:hypothetical protein ACI76Y_08500 [Capnocytophaga cynodegmi]|uniref:hypothetical protein n=1 Tax=Capnocytophaga cynodegmi TaxID=28189 RepID=UPI00385F93F4
MQKTYYYHLFVACIEEGKTKNYDQYALGETHTIPLFFKELDIEDYVFDGEIGNYGVEVLNPDFRYEFPLSELFFDSVVKQKDLPTIEKFCKEKDILPNSYIIIYKKDLKINKETSFSYPNLYYVGEFEMSEEGKESEQFRNPHLF